jgi:hypothetical protein
MALMLRPVAVLIVLCAAAGPAAAEGKFAPIPRGPVPQQPPCTCRGSDGQQFQMGETICLRTAEGSRIARCVMVINNPSWEPTATPCPQAQGPFTPRPPA